MACVQGIANPVSLARHVMEDTPHCLLAAEGALKFARKIGFPVLENPLELVTNESHARSAQGENYVAMAENYLSTGDADNKQGFDTVGALALDSHGRLASATSTGVSLFKYNNSQNYPHYRNISSKSDNPHYCLI